MTSFVFGVVLIHFILLINLIKKAVYFENEKDNFDSSDYNAELDNEDLSILDILKVICSSKKSLEKNFYNEELLDLIIRMKNIIFLYFIGTVILIISVLYWSFYVNIIENIYNLIIILIYIIMVIGIPIIDMINIAIANKIRKVRDWIYFFSKQIIFIFLYFAIALLLIYYYINTIYINYSIILDFFGDQFSLTIVLGLCLLIPLYLISIGIYKIGGNSKWSKFFQFYSPRYFQLLILLIYLCLQYFKFAKGVNKIDYITEIIVVFMIIENYFLPKIK